MPFNNYIPLFSHLSNPVSKHLHHIRKSHTPAHFIFNQQEREKKKNNLQKQVLGNILYLNTKQVCFIISSSKNVFTFICLTSVVIKLFQHEKGIGNGERWSLVAMGPFVKSCLFLKFHSSTWRCGGEWSIGWVTRGTRVYILDTTILSVHNY